MSMLKPNEIAAIIFMLEQSGDVWEVNKPDATGPTVEYIVQLQRRSFLLHRSLIELFTELRALDEDATDEQFQQVFYNVGKEFFGKDNLRRFFQDIYLLLTRRVDHGSRLGIMVRGLGIDHFEAQIARPVNY